MTDNLFHEYTFGVKRVRFTYENEDGTIFGTEFEQNNSNNANNTLVNNDYSICKSNETTKYNNEENSFVNKKKYFEERRNFH